MSDQIRTSPLTGDELHEFYEKGYLRPGRVLDDARVDALRDVIARRKENPDEAFDLLDPELWPATRTGNEPRPERSVDFLFDLWRSDETFRSLAFDPVLARWARQLIGYPAVRVLEDNALDKPAGIGGELRWHQDWSYWPIAQPSAVTAWIALDDVDAVNGAMSIAVGSHLAGERLPADFGTGEPYLRDRRPSWVHAIEDPVAAGYPIEIVELGVGEVSFHSALTWHASGVNDSDRSRRAAVVRYVGDGTTWLGARRYDYNYTDEQIGIVPGDPITGDFFPLVDA